MKIFINPPRTRSIWSTRVSMYENAGFLLKIIKFYLVLWKEFLNIIPYIFMMKNIIHFYSHSLQ